MEKRSEEALTVSVFGEDLGHEVRESLGCDVGQTLINFLWFIKTAERKRK